MRRWGRRLEALEAAVVVLEKAHPESELRAMVETAQQVSTLHKSASLYITFLSLQMMSTCRLCPSHLLLLLVNVTQRAKDDIIDCQRALTLFREQTTVPHQCALSYSTVDCVSSPSNIRIRVFP